jgi:hypothetical protein
MSGRFLGAGFPDERIQSVTSQVAHAIIHIDGWSWQNASGLSKSALSFFTND